MSSLPYDMSFYKMTRALRGIFVSRIQDLRTHEKLEHYEVS